MPTKTFFNLSDGKREKLMEAIRSEFARVPFEDISINRIIHMAEIPRGSFYQYFDDKHDMLRYLLSDYRRIMLDNARGSLKESSGDLFQMFLDIYDFTYSFVMQVSGNSFFKNLFADIRINIDFYASHTEEDSLDGFIEELLPYAKTEMLDIRDNTDIENMLSVLLTVTGEALARTFFDLPRHEDTRGQYIARLGLLKRGFLRKGT